MGEDSKKWAWTWVTSDQALLNTSGFVKKVLLCPDGSNAAVVTVRNGVDTGGEVACVVRCPATSNGNVNFPTPLYLDKGLFIDCGTNLDGVLVQYKKE